MNNSQHSKINCPMDPVLAAVVDKVTTSEYELVSDPNLANSLACDLWRHRNKEIRQQPSFAQ